MAGEYGNVRSAIAERGYEKGNYVETVEKILTETSVQDFLFQIFVVAAMTRTSTREV